MSKVEMKSIVMLLFCCIYTVPFRATEAIEFPEAIASTEAAETIEEPNWGYYQGGIPPPLWFCLENSEMCAGTMQSPVNSKTRDLVKNNNIEPFDFSELQKTSGIKMELTNTGLSVKVEFPDHQPIIKGGGLPGPHKLLQIHLHWGGNSERGSEHTINGNKFAMEVSIQSDKEVLDNFQIIDLFPKTTRCWYRYCGSLTTPPCTETVIWTVFEMSISMSEYQLKEFRKLMGEQEIFTEGDNNLVDTFRPVQPLLQRKVSLSCPCNRNNSRGRNLRKTKEYGCINHGYGDIKSHQTYSHHSSGTDKCLFWNPE
ncbi:CA4 [Mytilus coruscus]|uniref:carbonic anhydrase n=1 Tax=Mytilus coruscus TaxID=42192 RepID=A0A6J8C889_MYTCO|nr:CA4 [Mytilus coruscus]